jgi:hypothetical protein
MVMGGFGFPLRGRPDPKMRSIAEGHENGTFYSFQLKKPQPHLPTHCGLTFEFCLHQAGFRWLAIVHTWLCGCPLVSRNATREQGRSIAAFGSRSPVRRVTVSKRTPKKWAPGPENFTALSLVRGNVTWTCRACVPVCAVWCPCRLPDCQLRMGGMGRSGSLPLQIRGAKETVPDRSLLLWLWL